MDFIEHLLKYYPPEIVDSLLESLNKPDTHAVLLNPQKMTDDDFISLFPHVEKHPLIAHAFYYQKEEYPLGKSLFHAAGAFYLQDPSAMLAASFLKLKPQSLVLDICAAPGGKTIQTAFNHPDSLIVSNDLSYQRANVLSQNIERFGFSNVIVTAMDPKHFPTRFHHLFDTVILDAPCSGSGMFRKQAEMKEDWTYEKVLSCAQRQRDLLSLADLYLADDGFLLYSTCSFSYEEDEEPLLNFLKEHENYEVIHLPFHSSFYEHPSLPGTIHLLPSLYRGEGQFIALLHKKGLSSSKSDWRKKAKPYQHPHLRIFPLEDLFLLERNKKIYGLPYPFNLDNLTVIRAGLEIGEAQKERIIPSLALARYLSWERNIELDEEQCASYLNGESLALDLADKGYYTVSYHNLPLGFIRFSNGQAKNCYPKGLRHKKM